MLDILLIVVAVVLWVVMQDNGWGPITAGVVLVVAYFFARIFFAALIAGLTSGERK